MKKFYYQMLTGFCFLFITCCVFAQPGAPDIKFGKNGKITLMHPGAITTNNSTTGVTPIPAEIKVQPDQKILVLAMIDSNIQHYNNVRCVGYQYFLYRLKPNGTFDSSFGTNGSSPIIDNERPTAMELLPGGKILVSSQIAVKIDSIEKGINFCLSRYNSNGSIDNTFGTNGKTITTFDSCLYAIPTSLFVLGNGKIIQAGAGSSGSLTFLTLAGFNANGTPDATYGINSRVAARAKLDGGLSSWGNVGGPGAVTMLKLSDNKIVAAYNDLPLWPLSMSFTRFTNTGQADNTFGINGTIKFPNQYSPVIYGGAVQPDDKMVLVVNGFQVLRFNPDGSKDSAFIPSIFLSDFSQYNTGMSAKIVVEADKKLSVLYNETSAGPAPFHNILGIQSWLGRINSNGTPDSAFGKRGIRVFPTYFMDLPNVYSYPVLDGFTTFAIDSTSQYVLAGFRRSNGGIPGFDSGVVTHLYNNRRGRFHNNITGAVFYDQNHNGVQDAGEPIINNAEVAAIKTGIDTVLNWNMRATYDLEVDTGIYKTQVNPAQPYFNIVPASKTTSHATYFNTDTVSFALQPLAGKRDISVNIAPLTSLVRSNNYLSYTIIYQNLGTDTLTSGTVTLNTDTALFYNSSIPYRDSVVGSTIKWNFTNLRPQEVRRIDVSLFAYAGSISMGQQICLQARINPIAGDLDTVNNVSSICQTGLGSHDPNDKTEAHGGKIKHAKAISGEYLTYTIRFQNTGNDTAFNVYIRDTMDSKLDWNSLQIVASSHNYQMTMNDGKCLFTFPFIMLVDSIKNEPKSHGYIVYKIKAKPNVQIGDVIKNTAAIYFDYNLPIFTNTEMTTVVAEAFPLHLLSFTAKKIGKANLLNWSTTNEINVDRFEVERSPNGRDFSKIGITKANGTNQTNTYQYSDAVAPNTPLWGAGGLYYRLKMIDRDGQFSYSPIRQITTNNSPLIISIFPNPAKDVLQVQVESDKKTALQLIVLSADGKVLMSKSITANEGSSLQSINISILPKGSYLLKVKSDKDEQVMKFEKL